MTNTFTQAFCSLILWKRYEKPRFRFLKVDLIIPLVYAVVILQNGLLVEFCHQSISFLGALEQIPCLHPPCL